MILSDGEANIPFNPATEHNQLMVELLQICTRIGADDIASLVIDTRPLQDASGDMREIAEALGGDYHHISSLKAHGVLREIANF